LFTQLGDSMERAIVLDEGADDYILKDCSSGELLARIRAVLRRTQNTFVASKNDRFITIGRIRLDRFAKRLWVDSSEVSLTTKAMTMLEYFLLHPEELITREKLMNTVWGFDCPVSSRALDTRVAELRKALGCDAKNPLYIETVLGQGYRFIGSNTTKM
jgi:DNA-binding response OmpR family regulator